MFTQYLAPIENNPEKEWRSLMPLVKSQRLPSREKRTSGRGKVEEMTFIILLLLNTRHLFSSLFSSEIQYADFSAKKKPAYHSWSKKVFCVVVSIRGNLNCAFPKRQRVSTL